MPVSALPQPLRKLLFLLGFATFFQGYAAALPTQVLSDAGTTFGLVSSELGPAIYLIALGSLGALIAAPTADRYGRRTLIITSTFLFGILSALAAAMPVLFVFSLLLFLARVFLVAQYAAVITLIAEEFPAERRGRAIGLVTAAGGLGVVALVLFDRAVSGPSGWRLVTAAALLAILPAFWMRSSLKESGAWERARDSTRVRLTSIPLLRRGRRQLFQIGFIFLFAYSAFFGAATWWMRYAEQERGFTAGSAETLLSVAYVLGLTGYLFGGWLGDRIGRRRAGTYLLIAAGLAGVGVFKTASSGPQAFFMVLATFFALGASPVVSAMGAELFSLENRVASIAFVRGVFATAGGIMGPLLVGLLADSRLDIIGNIGDSVLIVSLALIPAILLIRALPESAARSLESLAAAARIPAPETPFVLQLGPAVPATSPLFPPQPTTPEPIQRPGGDDYRSPPTAN